MSWSAFRRAAPTPSGCRALVGSRGPRVSVACDRFYTLMVKRAIIAAVFLASTAAAQSPDTVTSSPVYWRRLAAGAATSILLHEAAHITTSYAVGGHPSFGFDKLRPTVYSGIVLTD